MRIAHVVKQFYPIKGGMENFVLSLAKEQMKQGFAPKIITLNRVMTDLKMALSESDEVEGVPVRRIPFSGPFRYPLAPSVLRYLKDVDIIHVHGVEFFSDYLALTRPLHKKPLVLTTHGGFFHTPFALLLKKVFFATLNCSNGWSATASCCLKMVWIRSNSAQLRL